MRFFGSKKSGKPDPDKAIVLKRGQKGPKLPGGKRAPKVKKSTVQNATAWKALPEQDIADKNAMDAAAALISAESFGG
jgi:hypothetical protein